VPGTNQPLIFSMTFIELNSMDWIFTD